MITAGRAYGLPSCQTVILCLGWAYDRDESITSRGLAAVRHGWQLIDGDPAAWVAMNGVGLPNSGL
jgi:hypothetical protein